MDHFTTCVLIATSLVLPWRAPSWTSGGPKYFIQCVVRDIRASWLKNLIISFNKIWKPPRRDIGYFIYWRNFWTGAHPYFTLLANRFFTYINKIGSSARPVHTPFYLCNWGLFRLKNKVQQFVGLGGHIIKYLLKKWSRSKQEIIWLSSSSLWQASTFSWKHDVYIMNIYRRKKQVNFVTPSLW